MVLDLFECPLELLNDESFVAESLRRAVEASGATLLKEISHAFEPHGVTALGLLAESHMSIHTWPEYRYVGADIFTCGQTADPRKACDYLVEVFRAGRHVLRRLERGEAPGLAGAQPHGAPAALDLKKQPEGGGEDDSCPEPTFARTSG